MAGGKLKLEDSNGSDYAGFEAPASMANSGETLWVLPNDDGTVGQALVTDGAKNLSWSTVGSNEKGNNL
jgi:hypothetical protein